MKFKVIYSFDCTRDCSVNRFKPPFIRKWKLTENDSCYGLDYLEGSWINGKHRKYTAFLSKEEFKKFVNDCCLNMENIETLGMLDIDGWWPAMSFRHNNDYCIQSAYVCPFPEFEPKREITEEREKLNWNRLYKVMLNMFE